MTDTVKPRLFVAKGHCFATKMIPQINRFLDVQWYEWDEEPKPGDMVLFYVDDSDLNTKIDKAVNNGLRPIVDNLWEQPIDHNPHRTFLFLQNQNWFWIHEHHYCMLKGFDKLPFYHNEKTHRAFMPIRLERGFRNSLIEELGDLVDSFIWSYKNRILDNDPTGCSDFRYIHTGWFDATVFTLIVETAVQGNIFTTEKTWKPIFCGHPFMTVSQCGSLQKLRYLGFETFDNMFDESYDQEKVFSKRIQTIVRNCHATRVASWEKDSDTIQRINHNKNLFYSRSAVNQHLAQTIEDIMNYAETQ
jgi:hypothetical protein